MKRRDLIKFASTILASTSLGIFGGYGIKSAIDKKDKEISKSDNSNFTIEPKQLEQYEYSSPMPFDKKLIDELYYLNQNLTKGKITTLFSSMPSPLGKSIHPILDSVRGDNYSIKTAEDYMDFVRYATEKGFKCVYVLNTTRPFSSEEKSIENTLVPLFQKFHQAGIVATKLANPGLLELFHRAIPEIDIHLSTTSEYHNIQVYQNLINTYPRVKLINIATDDNHNFEFLNSMRKLFPNIKLEILTNESRCVKNCIARYYHQCLQQVAFPCVNIIANNPRLQVARNNLVNPWELDYYGAIGINNFKFSCAPFSRNMITDINYIRYYLEATENGIEKLSANDYLDKIFYGAFVSKYIRFKNNYKLSDFIKNYLPDVRHFVKQGARCASDCGVNCRYCFKFAEKLRDITQKDV